MVEGSENICAKRLQTNQRHSNNVASSFGEHSSAVGQKDLIDYWRQKDFQWSSVLKETTAMEDKRSSCPSRPGKRALSRSESQSYRQSTLSGNSPAAWTPKHREDMEKAGIFMEAKSGDTLVEDCEVSATPSSEPSTRSRQNGTFNEITPWIYWNR